MLFFNFIIALLISALVIWIVSKLNLGLTVRGYGAAIIAATRHRCGCRCGLLAAWPAGHHHRRRSARRIVLSIIAAVVLRFSDKFVPGMEVNGFKGAIIAAIAIGVVSWIISCLLASPLGITI